MLPNAELYDSWWAQGKDQPNGLSTGKAVQLWASFGFPQDVLWQLWQLADQNGDGELDVVEHRLAMHLVSMVRSGQPLPPSISHELKQAAAANVAPAPAPTPAPAPATMPAGAAPMPSPPMPAPAPATAAPAPAPAAPSGSMDNSVWALTDADGVLYKRMWSAANAAGRGRVDLQESQLQRSGLPPAALQQVFTLADRDGDGKLDLNEYLLACHLATRHLKLRPPPPHTPFLTRTLNPNPDPEHEHEPEPEPGRNPGPGPERNPDANPDPGPDI